MNNIPIKSARHSLRLGLLCLIALSFGLPAAHAGLTFELRMYRNDQGQTYQFYSPLSTNSTAPDAPLGTYIINSPQWPTSGSTRSFELTTNGLTTTAGQEHWTYHDFDTVMQEITNGTWTILFTNATTTNLFTFTVSAPTMTSNMLPATIITYPSNGALLLTNHPTFTWQGPGWPVEGYAYVVYSDWSLIQYVSLPSSHNDWTISTPIPDGIDYNLNLGYVTNNATPVFVAATPLNTNSSHQPISGWISTSTFETSASVSFAVTNTVNPGGAHTLVAHYAFDDSGNLGQDTSGHDNYMNGSSWWGSPTHQFDTDAEAGGGAVQFFGTSAMTPGDLPRTNWNLTLAGSFSVSAWVKTTASRGYDDDDALYGATIFWTYNDHGNTNDTIPLAITGSKAAFMTRDHLGNSMTLHSGASVNDGNYHMITVTRNQSTGEKKIYVDGNLEASETGTTDPLNGNDYWLSIGGSSSSSYTGLLDDVQLYSGVLSASAVAGIYNSPGSTAPDVAGGISLGDALNAPELAWTTTGDAAWFGQTNNTHDGVSAAQSGGVTGSQSSTLSTTVTGPGTLTFYWSSLAEDPNGAFFYEFYIDGDYVYDIYGDWSWTQDGSHTIAAGQHTLRWTVYASDDTDPNQAGFLDQVTYVPDLTPIITLNPFNQTNYPGYNAALLAAATNSSSINWQWFKVGSASPIPNATNALYIPTNSGTAGVAGSYYAVASAPAGSANTATASVSFVSAPLPPAWAHALKSPFGPVDGSVFNKDYYLGCAVDPAGDIYVAAQYFGNMNVRTNGNVENILTAPGSYGAALVKHSASGNALWAVGLTNNQTGNSYGMTVAVAPGNGAYLASQIGGTNWLGTNRFVETAGSSLLLSRFDSSGSNVWSKLIGGTNSVRTSYNLLVADDSGNVTLGGSMSGTVSFGGTNLSAPAGGGFIVQFDATGAVRWAQTVPDYTSGLADGSGLLYVSLQSTVSDGVTNVSIGSLSNVTDRAWAVACLNASNGKPLWLRGVGHQYGANSAGLTIDWPLISVSGSNVFLTANTFGSSVVFGGLSVPLPGGRGQYFARYDTNGTPWAANGFGSPTTMLWASGANASGVYVTGDFNSYSQFGSLLIAAPAFTTNDLDFTYNGFDYIYFTQPLVAKFDLNGNPLWSRNGVSSAFANFRGIATTSDGVWASGFLKIRDLSSPAQFGTNFVSSDLYVPGGGGPSPIIFTQAGMIAKIADAPTATPVTLLSPQIIGLNFQFQFLSQAGFNHSILYRTNPVAGDWQTNSAIAGDGTLITITVPLSVFDLSKQGFIRVSTH